MLVCASLALGILAMRFDCVLQRDKRTVQDSAVFLVGSALFVSFLGWMSVCYLFCIVSRNFCLGRTSFERFSLSHIDYLTEDLPGSKGCWPNCVQMGCDREPQELEKPLLR